MSARGKRKDDEDHVYEGDAPPKKTFRKDSDETDEIVVCEISKNRRVMVRNWQGKIVVDIREFYVKDGKQMPGKKGAWKNLCGTFYGKDWRKVKECTCLFGRS
ncbi:RNA polymerase II transcriptional coactivator KIWI-like isoform X2 [Cucurbita moschata]|uniref:RNA polymerase II transcriptional coactivator KIWI-like isoform X2 n=1 Tax=Cucurbita moschata TaxID=3662 RepID=A0A6J1EXX8_CUCMO|nr:RNA polymerase II transcriptional coactivator KIWI-like isoform X2 [Cucurbita moschata]